MQCDGDQGSGGGALLHRTDELLAVVDELAEEAEHAACAGWSRRAVGSRIEGWLRARILGRTGSRIRGRIGVVG
jgi:hypothetical protein